MPRRFRSLVAVALCGVPLLAGCDPWHQQQVQSEDKLPPYLQEANEDPSFEHPEELRGFFKPTRTSGAWSSEAREIERSLGAIP